MSRNVESLFLRASLVGVVLAAACDSGPAEDTTERATATDVVRVDSPAEEQRMREYVDNHYRPEDVVHTFSMTTGDVVDCVDMLAQPSLRGKQMDARDLARGPSTEPTAAPAPAAPSEVARPDALLRGDLDSEGRARRCPAGTIPIQRLTIEQLRRFRTLEDFRQKKPSHLGISTTGPEVDSDIEPPALGSTASHQYAYVNSNTANWGAETYINLWNPYVEKSNEFSLSQMWIARGSGANRETVEVGVQKYQDLYGNGTPRLFIYFTPDNYGSGGCYNLSCSGFVQTNNSVVIGGPFGSYSTSGGQQYEFKILWYKDGANGHWWLRYYDTWVGYYPRTLFDANGLQSQAARFAYGGEIIDAESSRHTYTDMGSGAFASAGWQQAAYQRKLLYVNTSNTYTDPGALTGIATDSNCYSISVHNDPGNWGRYFWFGGPGYNSNCE